MPIFQTVADYEKWRRRRLRERLSTDKSVSSPAARKNAKNVRGRLSGDAGTPTGRSGRRGRMSGDAGT